MWVLGVVGAIASGKTSLARMLGEMGARVVSGDQIGHRVLETPEVKKALVESFGRSVCASDGRVDRRKLAAIVFEREEDLRMLERLSHPLIVEGIRNEIEQARRSGSVPGVVVDAALLYEMGADELCDRVVFVETQPESLRIERLSAGHRLDKREAARRQSRQESLNYKKKKADYRVDNSKDIGYLNREAQRLWSLLNRLATTCNE